jgi:hypothetical protein
VALLVARWDSRGSKGVQLATRGTSSGYLITGNILVSPRDGEATAERVDAIHARAVERALEIVYPLRDEEWGVRRFMLRGRAARS